MDVYLCESTEYYIQVFEIYDPDVHSVFQPIKIKNCPDDEEPEFVEYLFNFLVKCRELELGRTLYMYRELVSFGKGKKTARDFVADIKYRQHYENLHWISKH